MKHEKRTFTLRQEANAITCWAFRNGFLEELHAGEHSELLDKPNLARNLVSAGINDFTRSEDERVKWIADSGGAFYRFQA